MNEHPKPILPYAAPAPAKSSVLMLAIVWAVVTIPALWGVSKTVQTSMKLFQTPTAATMPTATSQPATTSPAALP